MHRFCGLAVAVAGALLIICARPSAQPVFTGTEVFPPEEFAAGARA